MEPIIPRCELAQRPQEVQLLLSMMKMLTRQNWSVVAQSRAAIDESRIILAEQPD